MNSSVNDCGWTLQREHQLLADRISLENFCIWFVLTPAGFSNIPRIERFLSVKCFFWYSSKHQRCMRHSSASPWTHLPKCYLVLFPKPITTYAKPGALPKNESNHQKKHGFYDIISCRLKASCLQKCFSWYSSKYQEMHAPFQRPSNPTSIYQKHYRFLFPKTNDSLRQFRRLSQLFTNPPKIADYIVFKICD